MILTPDESQADNSEFRLFLQRPITLNPLFEWEVGMVDTYIESTISSATEKMSEKYEEYFLDHTYASTSKKRTVIDDRPTLYFSTPFLGPCSLQLKSRISRLIKQCYPSHKLWIVFSTPKRLAHFFPFKDSIPKLLRSSVVYCYKCPSSRYYGKTSRNLAIRWREHIGVSKTGYKMNNNSSAVYNHSSSTGHPVSSEDFKIISSTRNSMDLLIHESLLILRDRPNLNSQTSSIQLTLF